MDNLNNITTKSCDIIIIGAGGAGLRAAIAAHDTNPRLNITIITKGKPGSSGVTALACSDRMAFHATLPFTPPGMKNNWKLHADDIYRIGGFVSDRKLADKLIKSK